MHLKTYRLLPVAVLGLLLVAAPGCSDDDEEVLPPEETAFVFSTDEPDDYTQVDRVGAPLVSYALITDRTAYDRDTPTDDESGKWVAELTTNVAALHAELDDDLTAANLTPCATALCLAQAAPLVRPDRLRLDPEADAGFPNGRRLTDQAPDILFAALLLDVTTPGTCAGEPCTTETFADMPLNPPENDVPFRDDFPYLASPHAP